MKLPLARLGPLCGLLAAVVFLALFVTAMILDPGWQMGGMWLSDLGVRQAAWAFNTACVLAGLLLIPYALSLPRVLHRGAVTWVGAVLFLVAAGFLIGVGVFTEHFGSLHTIVSFGFFGTLVLGWIVLAYPMHKTAAFGGLGAVINVVALLVNAASAVLFNAYTLEAVVVLSAVVWGILTAGILLARQPTAAAVLTPASNV